jgi:TonB family protein
VRALATYAAWLGAAAVVAAPPPPLTLGGIAIGRSVLEAVRSLGMPDVVDTTDSGHLWQWARSDGLDREVMTDDDLVVTQVLVARTVSSPSNRPTATPAPAPRELPLLGMSPADAGAAVVPLGGVALPQPDPDVRAWSYRGGVVVAQSSSGAVVRVIALDDRSARFRGFLQPPLAAAVRTAPKLVSAIVSHPLPAGAGIAIVRVTIDAQGRVADEKVVVPSGDGDVDRWVLENIRKSTFLPATCAGVPCAGVYLDIDGLDR